MHNRKAQAAMEFLMTYGWAIIIILVALAALFFLGVFSSSTSNRCQAVAPLICNDVKLADGASDVVTLVLGSGSVSSASIETLGCKLTAPANAAVTPSPTALTIGSTSAHTCTFAGTVTTRGQKFSGYASVIYTTIGSTLTHNTTITFAGTVE